ncbi:MAG: hypothetical protein HQK49_05390 [Oligoflexia bacterium]|nr:hypothetical protein [Oligoflexia bacterium]
MLTNLNSNSNSTLFIILVANLITIDMIMSNFSFASDKPTSTTTTTTNTNTNTTNVILNNSYLIHITDSLPMPTMQVGGCVLDGSLSMDSFSGKEYVELVVDNNEVKMPDRCTLHWSMPGTSVERVLTLKGKYFPVRNIDKYAILAPVSALKERFIGGYPNDIFTMGEFSLSDDSILFVPENEYDQVVTSRNTLGKKFKVISYPSKEVTAHQTATKYLENQGSAILEDIILLFNKDELKEFFPGLSLNDSLFEQWIKGDFNKIIFGGAHGTSNGVPYSFDFEVERVEFEGKIYFKIGPENILKSKNENSKDNDKRDKISEQEQKKFFDMLMEMNSKYSFLKFRSGITKSFKEWLKASGVTTKFEFGIHHDSSVDKLGQAIKFFNSKYEKGDNNIKKERAKLLWLLDMFKKNNCHTSESKEQFEKFQRNVQAWLMIEKYIPHNEIEAFKKRDNKTKKILFQEIKKFL